MDFIFTVGLWAVVALAILWALTTIVIVPERNFYTTTLFGGSYHRTLSAGINFKWPTPIEMVDKRRSTIIEQFKLTATSITKDKAQLALDVTIQYKADEDKAYEAAYALENPIEQIRSYIDNTMRSEINQRTIDDVFASTNEFEVAIKEHLKERFEGYGFIIENVLVDQPRLSKELTDAYEQKILHTRLREAATEEGETTKIKRVMGATADREALKITGEAYVDLRDAISVGNAEAINKFIIGIDDRHNSLTAANVLQFFNKINEYETLKEIAKAGGKIVYVVSDGAQDGKNSVIPQVIAGTEATAHSETTPPKKSREKSRVPDVQEAEKNPGNPIVPE